MSNKVQIGISARDPNLADAKARLLREEIRANEAVRALQRAKRRIREFFARVDYVAFPEDAPDWAVEWKDWLLDGSVPRPAPAEPPAEDKPPQTEVQSGYEVQGPDGPPDRVA